MQRRRLDGALLLDKPTGLSSNAALQRARKCFGAEKAGHAGTLDPLASGLLVVLFGEATKFAGHLLDDDKEYVAELKLGEKTSTGDAEGEVVETGERMVRCESIEPALARFRGEIEQVPPMYSALKRDGVPLYELARRGETVARAPRRVRISLLEPIRYEPPLLVLRARCSKGTYVRTLAEDVAGALGTVAHLTGLRRTASGAFSVESACGLQELEALAAPAREARLLELRTLLQGMPRADLDEDAERRFRSGQALPLAGLQGIHAVFGRGGRVLGLANGNGRSLQPVRLMASQEAE